MACFARGPGPGDADEIEAGGEVVLVCAEGFSDSSFELIADGRLAESPGDGQAQSRVSEPVGICVDDEVGVGGAATAREDSFKVFLPRESLFEGEAERLWGHERHFQHSAPIVSGNGGRVANLGRET